MFRRQTVLEVCQLFLVLVHETVHFGCMHCTSFCFWETLAFNTNFFLDLDIRGSQGENVVEDLAGCFHGTVVAHEACASIDKVLKELEFQLSFSVLAFFLVYSSVPECGDDDYVFETSGTAKSGKHLQILVGLSIEPRIRYAVKINEAIQLSVIVVPY